MKSPPRNFVADPFTYGQELDLEIEDLTNLGQGVARHDGWVIFVPFALPGERVVARIWRNKKSYSDADLVSITRPSPDRVEAPCPLFGDCGGCQYQHYSYAAQLRWKQKQIAGLLRKMAALDFPVNDCIGLEEHGYGYRSKITPHFRRPPHIPGTSIGFQRFASRSIVDVPHCPIASESVNAKLGDLRKQLKSGELDYRRGGTLLLRDSVDGVVTNMREEAVENVGEFCFGFVAGEFFQNNPHVLPLMIDYALKEAKGPDSQIEFLVDAYCGVGVFAICGHKDFKEIVGVEVNEQAIRLAEQNLSRNDVSNVRFQLSSAEVIFDGLNFAPDRTAVLLDPPRKGCDSNFLEQLIRYAPARIVYVSCGPDTQARDLKVLMDAGYSVVAIQPVDLFPQTRHIENIVTLVAPSSSA